MAPASSSLALNAHALSAPSLDDSKAYVDADELGYEPDYSDLEPDEWRQRTDAAKRANHRVRSFWPEDLHAQQELAAERLSAARQNATLFRARRLKRTRHGLEEEDRFFSTGIAAIDEVLGGGLQRNELIEFVGWRSSGRFSMVLSTLAAATQKGEAAALVDLGDQLDPQAALGAGVDLERLLWLRPQHIKQAMRATELLIGAGFPLIVFDLGQPPVRGGRGVEAGWLRLQRGAIDHHAALLVSSPYRASGTAAHAVVELHGARGGWFSNHQANRGLNARRHTQTSSPKLGSDKQSSQILGGLMCAAELSKSRLGRLEPPTQTDRSSARFDLYFASGLAEPLTQLPSYVQTRRRSTRVASAFPSAARALSRAG